MLCRIAGRFVLQLLQQGEQIKLQPLGREAIEGRREDAVACMRSMHVEREPEVLFYMGRHYSFLGSGEEANRSFERSDVSRLAIETKAVFELEHRVLKVDGTVGWTHSQAVPLFAPEGEITEWLTS